MLQWVTKSWTQLSYLTELNCSPPGSSVHGIFSGRNTEVGCHFLLQGIFPGVEPITSVSSALQTDSLPLSHREAPEGLFPNHPYNVLLYTHCYHQKLPDVKKQENMIRNERGKNWPTKTYSELSQMFKLAVEDIKSLEICST